MIIKINNFKIIEISTQKFGNFVFSDSVNIISGNNKQGKSTLIKSIMYTLGFSVKKWADNFDRKDFIYILNINIGDRTHEIIRMSDKAWFINEKVYDLSDYRKFLKHELNITSELIGKDTHSHIPYPTDLFLFNYVDQDDSYNDLFKGNHQSRTMYDKNELEKIYKEYIGLSNDDILKLQNYVKVLRNEKNDLINKQKLLKNLLEKHETKKLELISFSVEEYKKEIEKIETSINEFLLERNKLEREKFKILNNLKEYDFEKIQLENLYDELEKNTASVKCKFCNSKLNQTFEQRYERELSKTSIVVQYVELKNLIKEEENKLKKNNEKIEICEKKLLEIQELFSNSKSNLKFAEIIENNVKFGIIRGLNDEYTYNANQIDDKERLISDTKKNIDVMKKEQEEYEKEIKNFYHAKIKEVNSLFPQDDASYFENRFMMFQNKKTGSDSNISLVIGYYIYFSILVKYSKIKFPIIWDTFIKEALDTSNAEGLEKLINEHVLKLNTQIICSNIPETDKDIKIKNIEKYNVIEIKEEICNTALGDTEKELLDKIFYILK
ncbi:hypothetical protein IX317_001088 [Fusobacterium sp. DD29]|uniref:AAA family ATPase n=1 Tax=unclassified Fusobacterium TaxID=2648384 RepID=UPI001B8CEEA0|nr:MULTISPECIES: AAA family ATPase [unclassified Fusobacterium]MBR8701287.1 hypothetical protein [Fusobacterium sp. DD45]MBR8711097.1 hypothetical protein [Fusobacterium sp. DD28]MBR8749414.1 hypothetical protein [Fusobacterium sp. DD29]MBR8751671.1 hypothetical protein [Fusobacterium sp. DD26]MBR8761696.1 hypothetical protein [Fusobacterium sp. DD25]